MRRISLLLAGGIALLGVLAGVWLVLASRLFVWLAGLSAYFPSPWVTWWLYATQARADRWTRLYLSVSGVVAAIPPLVLLAGAIVMALGLVKRQGTEKPVYGQTDWADRKQMAGRDISATAKLP